MEFGRKAKEKKKEIKIKVNIVSGHNFKKFLNDLDGIMIQIEKIEEEHSCNCTLLDVETNY